MNIYKQSLWVTIATILISICIVLLGLSSFVSKVLTDSNTSPFSGKQTVLELYYSLSSNINSDRVGPFLSKRIQVVDAGQCSRKQIATIIDDLSRSHASIIGLDIIFPALMDNEADSALVHAIKSNDKIVLSYGIDENNNDSRIGSFYDKYFEVEGKTYGYTNFYDSFNRIKLQQMTNKALEKCFSLQIASSLSPVTMPKKEIPLINYLHSDFTIIDGLELIYNHEKFNDFNNAIVLIGCVNDERDIHQTYAGLKPGVIINAYAIETILNSSYLREMPLILVWVVSIIFVYLFSILEIKIREKKRGSIIITLVEIIFMFVIVGLCTYSFFYHHLVIDCIPYLISISILIIISPIFSHFIK